MKVQQDMKEEKIIVDLFQAYFDARKNKRNKKTSLYFERNFEENIFSLFEQIVSRKYCPKPSICFGVTDPVHREIFAADFSDRVVHHLIYNYISPIFEKTFINDCYSCRKGRGVHYGIKRVEKFIRSCSQNYKTDCFVLKLDIKSYFMSINKGILFSMVRDKLLREKSLNFDLDVVLYLLEETIFDNPLENCVIRGKVSVPFGKSLFDTPPNCGLPIGNLTSQLFGNIYLSDFDVFVKRSLGLRHYGRYVDDIIIIHKDKAFLKAIVPKIKLYLYQNLGLTLHPNKIYLQHYSKGFKFLGSYIKPYRKYIINRTKRKFQKSLESPNESYFSSVNSYLGLLSHCSSYTLRKKYIEKYLPGITYGVRKDFSAIFKKY